MMNPTAYGEMPTALYRVQPGDDLLEVAIDYVTSNSPVGPVVEGRIVGP